MDERLVLAYDTDIGEPRWMDRAEANDNAYQILEDTADTAPAPAADFDPDAFLAGTDDFDPDKFLGTSPQVPNTPAPPAAKEPRGIMRTIGDEVAQGATKNWLDETAGAIVGGDVGETMTANMRRDLHAGEEAHPIAGVAANIGGEVMSDLALSRVIPGYFSQPAQIAMGAISGGGRGEGAAGKVLGAGVGAGAATVAPYAGKFVGSVLAKPARALAAKGKSMIDEALLPLAQKAYDKTIKPIIAGNVAESKDFVKQTAAHQALEADAADAAAKRIGALEEAGAVATRKAGDILYPKKVFQTLTPQEKLELALKKLSDEEQALQRSKAGYEARAYQAAYQADDLYEGATPDFALNAQEKLRRDFLFKQREAVGKRHLNAPLPEDQAAEAYAADAADLARKKALLEGKLVREMVSPPKLPVITPEQKALGAELLNDPDWLRVTNPKLWQKIQADVPAVPPAPIKPQPANLPQPLNMSEQELASQLRAQPGSIGGTALGLGAAVMPGMDPVTRGALRRAAPGLLGGDAGAYARGAAMRKLGGAAGDLVENATTGAVTAAGRQLRPDELEAIAQWLMGQGQ